MSLWAARLTGPASVLRVQAVSVRPGTVDLDIAGVVVPADVPNRNHGRAAGALSARAAGVGPAGRPAGRPGHAVRFRGPHTDYRLDTPVGPVEVRGAGGTSCACSRPHRWAVDRVWLVAELAGGPGLLLRE